MGKDTELPHVRGDNRRLEYSLHAATKTKTDSSIIQNCQKVHFNNNMMSIWPWMQV
jgi:hypothetical protein